jgi:DNA repair exonuclease SbcCD ATPase subunit
MGKKRLDVDTWIAAQERQAQDMSEARQRITGLQTALEAQEAELASCEAYADQYRREAERAKRRLAQSNHALRRLTHGPCPECRYPFEVDRPECGLHQHVRLALGWSGGND